MRLDFLIDYEVRLTHPAPPAGLGPFGQRMLAAVTGGSFKGPLLKGTIAQGGDWGLVDAAGVLRLDARVMFLTDDGAALHGQYFGVLKSLDGSPAIKMGGATAFGEQYFMTAPRFETGDSRYLWINDLVCVAEGRQTEGGVCYRVHALANGG
jgi:hypothetical protein